ncbi:inositol monophosphatase [Pelagibius sp.]|uniref:inositol monophosphatase family protein n=1 Tax=Pelagibius sp. TaxID=1931238 RepID=UPI0026261A38|nr:inositol monophosphatase [Pelagibius sp.]
MQAMKSRYEYAQSLAREAGQLAYDYYRRRDEIAVENKGLQDAVSIADKEVEALIRSRLAAKFPDDGFLGEESGTSDRFDQNKPIWVVDPIDGTACFLNGMPSWCVSIALVSGGEIELGVIYDPNTDELFAARRGGGTFLNGARQPVPTAAAFSDGLLGTGFSHRSPTSDFVPFLDGLLRDGGLFLRNGSGALMLAYVAAGRLIGYFEPHINSWDSLAGLLLVREAGGWTCDFLANEGLLRGGLCAACAPALAPAFQALLAATVPAPRL